MLNRKIFTIFCAIFLLISSYNITLTGFAAFSPSFDLYSEGIYMVNLDTDIVIVSKNADKKMYPASTTKIMTCLVALENIKDFSAYVECPYVCFNEFNTNPNNEGVSNAEIEPLQNNLTYMDCLYALMLPSACEAANIVAYNVGGESIDNFIAMMNKTAEKVGCKNTHFANAHGLFDEDNYTTAYDLYLITKYAVENYPGFMKICNTYEYEMPANEKFPAGYSITHTNELLRSSSEYYCEGVKGIKTGSLDRYYYKKNGEWDYESFDYGSRALVTAAERNGYNYLTVTLGAPYFNKDGTMPERILSFVDHINLYQWAFDEFEYSQVIGKNQQVMQADVEKGLNVDKVGIITTEDFFTLMPRSLDKSSILQIKPVLEPMTAPVEKGTPVGVLELKLNGETLTAIPLVTENEVLLDNIEDYKEKLVKILKSPQFIASAVVLAALIVTYAVARTVHKRKKRKAAEMQRRRKIQMAPRGGKTNGNNRRR